MAESLIQTSHRGIADELHRHSFPREAQFLPNALEEVLQRFDEYANTALAIDDHGREECLLRRLGLAVPG